MIFKRKRAIPTGITLALVGVSSVLFLSVAELSDPETEFAKIRSELNAAQDQINAVINITGRPGLGPQTVEADENFSSALSYFQSGEYPATIRMLNNYLNNTQVPEFIRYQKAQYLLGRSYQHMGRSTNAIRAYLRYIAAFLTASSNDHQEFLDVLRRTVALSIEDSDQNSEASTLIASLTSLELPGEVKNIVNVIAAKSAVMNRNNNVASRLLEETIKNSGDHTLKAKAFYIKSLLAISQKNYESAEEYLSEATATEVDQTTKDLARLGLARLALKRNKQTLALRYYGMIEEKSEHFKEALFESIYVHIELGEDTQARAKAILFLNQFKDTIEAVQLRMILAYLDLKAGDYAGAKATLAKADERVSEVDKYLYKNLINKTQITASDLTSLSDLTAGHIDDTPAVKEAAKIFSKLSSLQKALADIDGEIRSVTLASSQAGLDEMNPTWVNRSEQLSEIGNKLLEIGHRLIATERNLYEKDIDGLNQQKLTSSENRRTKLIGSNVELKRRNINWKVYRDYLAVHMTLKESTAKLASTEASLASLKFAKNADKIDLTDGEINELTKKIAKLKSEHQELIRQTSMTKIKHTGKEGPHHGSRLFLSQYVISLEEESSIIEGARDRQESTAVRLLANDAKEYWRQWQTAIGSVLAGFKALDDEINKTLGESVQRLEILSTRQEMLAMKLNTIVASVETGLGANLHSILSEYSIALNKKSARNKKWKADIDWMDYQQKQAEESKLTEKFNIEQQILNENLRDIKQGLIW
jgi:tetratricopeptide (TPR) repeat protein